MSAPSGKPVIMSNLLKPQKMIRSELLGPDYFRGYTALLRTNLTRQ